MATVTYTLPRPVKGSCTKGHKWVVDLSAINYLSPTIQIGKKWCLLCIEAKLAELGVGEAT